MIMSGYACGFEGCRRVSGVDHGGFMISSGTVNLIINTLLGQQAYADRRRMRSVAIQHDGFVEWVC